jgi:hypothetical protein
MEKKSCQPSAISYEPATAPMRMSEAMRLGAMLHDQAYGELWTLDEGGAVIASCALGAAFEAAGLPMSREMRPYPILGVGGTGVLNWGDVPYEWQPLLGAPAELPCGCERTGLGVGLFSANFNVQGAIVHLNNSHHWTRERIADWLEGEEAISLSAVSGGRDQRGNARVGFS